MALPRASGDALPLRGDIIVFKKPDNPLQLMVKRVVGLPGEPMLMDDGRTMVVEPGRCFVMGDNRGDSLDSRAWGTVPAENIVARALYIWRSPYPDRTGQPLR